MQAHRKGTDLKIQIRLALLSLGRNPDRVALKRLSIAQLEWWLGVLRREQRERGDILKPR